MKKKKIKQKHNNYEFVTDLFKDLDDNWSSKRTITIIFSLLLAVGFIANMFFGFNIAETILNAIQYIIMAGLGAISSEKFVPNKSRSLDDVIADDNIDEDLNHPTKSIE
jgi:hypothetical protein